MESVRIYITDDHAILRDGLRLILGNVDGFEVIGESRDGEQALREIPTLKPDVAILDISLPGLSGIETCRMIRKSAPDVHVVILSRHDNEVYVEQLLSLGVSGYVLKENASADLANAIHAAIEGDVYLSPKLVGNIVRQFDREKHPASANRLDALTHMEKSVVKLIAEGKSSKEIGKLLCVEALTVKKHRSNIMKKLGIHNTADLVVFAIKNGLKEI